MAAPKINVEQLAGDRGFGPASIRPATELSTGFILALFLLLILLVSMVGIGWVSFVQLAQPLPPAVPTVLTAESFQLYKEAAQVYRELNELSASRAVDLFQLVATIVMASFNLIVGYILGSRNRE